MNTKRTELFILFFFYLLFAKKEVQEQSILKHATLNRNEQLCLSSTHYVALKEMCSQSDDVKKNYKV